MSALRGLLSVVVVETIERRHRAAMKRVRAHTALTERQTVQLLTDMDRLLGAYTDAAERMRQLDLALDGRAHTRSES